MVVDYAERQARDTRQVDDWHRLGRYVDLLFECRSDWMMEGTG